MQRVPYTRIPGLTDEQQRQIDRDFQEAARQLDEGVGQVEVPYRRIPGLDEETQRQIDRNFMELFCSGSSASPGDILASDTFARNENPLVATDSFAGGTTRLWNPLNKSVWEASTAGGYALYATNGTGGDGVDSEVVVDTSTLDVRVAATILTSAVVPVNGSGLGVVARCSGYANFITAFISKSAGVLTLNIADRIAGATTLRGSSPYTHPGSPGDDLIELEVIGSAVTAYFRGSAFGSYTTTLLTGTNQGLLGQNDLSGGAWRDFVVTAA